MHIPPPGIFPSGERTSMCPGAAAFLVDMPLPDSLIPDHVALAVSDVEAHLDWVTRFLEMENVVLNYDSPYSWFTYANGSCANIKWATARDYKFEFHCSKSS